MNQTNNELLSRLIVGVTKLRQDDSKYYNEALDDVLGLLRMHALDECDDRREELPHYDSLLDGLAEKYENMSAISKYGKSDDVVQATYYASFARDLREAASNYKARTQQATPVNPNQGGQS